MAEEGMPANGEHGREPTPLRTKPSMCDGIDASVQQHKPPIANAVADRGVADTKREQLPPGENTMLPSCELGDERIAPSTVELGVDSTPNFTVLAVANGVSSHRRRACHARL
jgi:hypothetical protein